MRTTYAPASARRRDARAQRAPPTWRSPVGEGAKRVRVVRRSSAQSFVSQMRTLWVEKMPERTPAMQGEVWTPEPRREPAAFSIGEALDDGLRALRRDGLVLSVAQLLAGLPGAAIALAARHWLGQPHFLSRAYFEQSLALGAVGTVLGALFRGGLVKMALDAERRERPKLGDLLRGMRHFPAMLALEVAHAVVLAASVVLLFVPYVLVWTRLALAPFALVDRDEGLAASVRWSWPAAKGERLHLFGFLAATAVVSYLGVIACCVGVFPAAALVSVATAHVYLRQCGAGASAAEPDGAAEADGAGAGGGG